MKLFKWTLNSLKWLSIPKSIFTFQLQQIFFPDLGLAIPSPSTFLVINRSWRFSPLMPNINNRCWTGFSTVKGKWEPRTWSVFISLGTYTTRDLMAQGQISSVRQSSWGEEQQLLYFENNAELPIWRGLCCLFCVLIPHSICHPGPRI